MKYLFLSVCLVFLVSAGVGRPDEKPNPIVPGSPVDLDGLLAYWKLDEGKGATAQDASTNKMKATLHGGRWTAGARGSALLFEKDGDYLDYGDSPLLNFNAGAPFTFAGWVKSTAVRGAIVSQRHSKDGGANIDLTLNDGKLTALVRADNKELGQHATVTGGRVNDGEWHHFTLTRDNGRTIELFIDGVSQGKAEGADAGGSITTNLRALGSERYWVRTGFPGPQFIGAVDEFCVFDRALSSEVIRKLAGPQRPTAATGAGAHVRVKLGGVNFEKAAPKLKVGQKALFKGEVAVAGSKGDEVVVHLADLYTGAEKPVSAADLTRELAADKVAFDKKYKSGEIIVEGVVTQLNPDNFSVVLAGATK
jgi:Concanavalin A-like lectin/glucanases superfamily